MRLVAPKLEGMSVGMRVALLYNLKSSVEQEESDPPDRWAELDSETTVHAIRNALEVAGYSVIGVEGNHTAVFRLPQEHIDIAFNICEGFHGRNREAHMPAILEMLGIPYAGADVLTLSLCLDKAMSKRILSYAGIPTARFVTYTDLSQVTVAPFDFPLFVKPTHEGSSKGISAQSKVHNLEELRRQVAFVCSTYHQPALVEDFLPGREFTVGILGNEHPFVFSPMEISYDHVPKEANGIYSYQYKRDWVERHNFVCPAPVTSELETRLKEVALAAYQAVGCQDFGRVDLRLDAMGSPHVIEINPLPGMAPGYSDFPVAAEANGIPYPELLIAILGLAIKRYGLVDEGAVLRLPLQSELPLAPVAAGSGNGA